MIISLDTETTGVDFAHGAAPFLVTTCDEKGHIRFWEWDVDPLTRQPEVPPDDVGEIAALIDTAELIYLQNAKFDAHALNTIGLSLPWEKVRDTLCAGHLLATNHPHDLTWMCIEYLGVNIETHELRVEEVVKACRKLVKRDHPTWRVAEEGLEDMPSVKSSSKRGEDRPWKNDMWLPRAYAKEYRLTTDANWAAGDYIFGSGWLDACQHYANADSEHTLPLGLEMERLVRERGLWAIYEHRLRLVRASYEMERWGVTAIGDYTEDTICAYEQYSAECAAALETIAATYGHKLVLADGATINDNMRDLFYGAKWLECPRCGETNRLKHWNGEGQVQFDPPHCPKCAKSTKKRAGVKHQMTVRSQPNLAMPVILGEKSGNATLDANAMTEYLHTTEGEPHEFISILLDKRKHDTALSYMRAYRRFWIPIGHDHFQIYPSLNPFGTDHLRWSSNNPNMQNASDRSDIVTTKSCFGPAQGREYWSMDYKSIEARIPAYESGEPKLVELFECADEPPYWGNQYYLAASVLYQDEFNACCTDGKEEFRNRHPRLYKQAKFFILAKNYGAGRKKGDKLSKVADSYDRFDADLPKLAALQRHYLAMAERRGYVETLPDRTVDPKRGYPVLASRTEGGRVLTTTPFNYHVSGTACWVKNTALLRCMDQCEQWRAEGFDAYLCLEVHDELLFDFPRGTSLEENLPRARVLQRLMEQSGTDLIPAIPTPVSVKYHDRTWADGRSV
jgi:DNA polymerase I-like protein with 3'-5' exonuclease and polymerase domains